ncbi:NYN domain-containing protein [Luteimonas pelagia]
MPDASTSQRLALLIDADNSNPAKLPQLLAEIAKYGTASVRRAYGNWTSGHLGGWKAGLLEHSIQPIQQFNYTTGKNATDSALIIDAMDLLYTGRLDGFCIASSDSDFTRLAARIREQGLTVYGFGERKTPHPFVAACDKFIYTENLGEETASTSDKGTARKAARKRPPSRDRKLASLLDQAVEAASDDSGWAQLGAVGSNLQRLAPDFDSRTYGYRKLRDLVEDQDGYTVEERSGADGRTHSVWVRAD